MIHKTTYNYKGYNNIFNNYEQNTVRCLRILKNLQTT